MNRLESAVAVLSWSKINFSFNLLVFSIFGLILLLSTISIIQLNNYTREFYSIENYEAKVAELGTANRNLELNFSKADSLGNLTAYVQNQNFEKTGQVKYIRILEETALVK